MKVSREFANILRTARIESGLTNQAFADKLGTSTAVVWRYEQCDHTPNIETVDRMLKKLGKTMTIGKG